MSTLFVISTPIGNLDDLSPRASEILRSVPRILAEDTRRTRVLADRVGAAAKIVSVRQHNERERLADIVGWLDSGDDLALVTDAGTPLVSDPGGRVVAGVVDAGFSVVPIPGPSAVMTALVGSGLPADRFVFLGFLARKGAKRRADLERVARSEETVVLFESPHRLVQLLEDLEAVCEPGRRVAVGRELTKIHEEFVRGTPPEVAGYYRERPPKGEVTVVVAPVDPGAVASVSEEDATDLAERLLAGEMRPSAVARELSERLGLARNEAYRIVHDLEGAPD